MAEALDIAEFDRLFCQQAQRPVGVALRRVRAGEHGQFGFEFARHFAWGGGSHGFVGERRL